VFSEVDPNPNEKNMADGIAVYLAGGHDGVICFGGGSALDLGKMIALMAGQRADLSVWDLEDIDDWWTRADAAKIAPIIAVPTTAGTGSEVGRAGVLTNSSATHKKKIIFHPEADAGRHDLRSGADRGHAQVHHRRHRHGCAGALP
jgi:alcohol dehydrogenase class IV